MSIKKRVILVHGWGGNPQNHWFPSVSRELQDKGFQVDVPEMPNTDKPNVNDWVNKIKEVVPKPNLDTFFIGHSLGCQAILRYIESLNGVTPVGKIVFVAPWLGNPNIIQEPISFETVKRHITSLTAIFSDNDDIVNLSDKEIFKTLFNAKIIVEHNKGHFCGEDGVNDFPLIVKEITSNS